MRMRILLGNKPNNNVYCRQVTTLSVVELSKVTAVTSHHIHLANHKRGNQNVRTVEVVRKHCCWLAEAV